MSKLIVADRSNAVAPTPGFGVLAKLLGGISVGASNPTQSQSESQSESQSTQSESATQSTQSTPVGVSNVGNQDSNVVSNDEIVFSAQGNQFEFSVEFDCKDAEESKAARNAARKCVLNGVERSKLAFSCSSVESDSGALCGAHTSGIDKLYFSHRENSLVPEAYETYSSLIKFCAAHGLSGEILSYMLYDEVKIISEMDLDGSGLPGDMNHPIYKYYRLCSQVLREREKDFVTVPAPEPGVNQAEPPSNRVEPTRNHTEAGVNRTEPTRNRVEPIVNRVEPTRNRTESAPKRAEEPAETVSEPIEPIMNDTEVDEALVIGHGVVNGFDESITMNVDQLIEDIGDKGREDMAAKTATELSERYVELKAIADSAKMPNFMEKLERKLGKIVTDKQFYLISGIGGSKEFLEKAIREGVPEIEKCSDKEFIVVKHIMSDLAKAHAARQEQKQLETGNRLANRALYLPCYTLQFYLKPGTKDYPETKLRWKFDTSLDSQGLLTRVVTDLGIPEEQRGWPTLLRLVLSDEIQGMIKDKKLSMEPMWEVMRKNHGWVVTASTSSNSYMAWNWNIESIRNILLKTFPDAIDMGGYNHRLGSPLIPGGYFETTVKFTEVMSYRRMTFEEFWADPVENFKKLEAMHLPVSNSHNNPSSGEFESCCGLRSAKVEMIEETKWLRDYRNSFSNDLCESQSEVCAEEVAELPELTESMSEFFAATLAGILSPTSSTNEETSQKIEPCAGRPAISKTAAYLLERIAEAQASGNIKDLQEFMGKAEVEALLPKIEISQEVDGSGLYDPDHEEMKPLVEKYGPTDFQLSVLGMDGLFAKGIITPRQGINEGAENGGHAIHIDLGQIKGAQKKKRKAGDTQKVYIGIMKSWQTEGTYPGNFEMLQMMKIPSWSQKRLDWLEAKERTEAQEIELQDIYNRKARQARFKELLEGFVEDSMEKLLKKGAKGILADLAKGDEHIDLAKQMLEQFEIHGNPISPMSVPYLEKFISDRLRKELHVIMQGAGIASDITPCVVIDAGVKKGTCVISGYKPGEQVAIWRYPMVLPQALVTCTVAHALDHHKVNGKIIKNTLFLNPAEITLGMQGDDDGDICGVSNDPKILELFSYKLDIGTFKIENAPKKMETKTDTDAGYEYIARNNRGPVGATTLMQARLFAAGDTWGAIAMAVLNQEAIDSAKKLFSWSNWELLARQSSWVLIDGIWHIKQEVQAASEYKLGSAFPVDELFWWHANRLRKLGIVLVSKKDAEGNKIEEEHNPISWRIQFGPKGEELKKRVHGPKMQPCRTQEIEVNGEKRVVGGKEGKCKARNVVHIVHDMTWRSYQKHATAWEATFKVDGKESQLVEIRELLPKLLSAKGDAVELTCASFAEYASEKGLKERAGFGQFGRDMKKAMGKKGSSESEKHADIQKAQQALDHALSEMSPADLATIWYWELTPTYRIAQKNAQGKSLPPIFTHEERKADNRTIFEANKPNNAFKAVAHPGSVILKLLGIKTKAKCGYATEPLSERWGGQPRVKVGVEELLKKQSPWTELAAIIWKSPNHGKARSDERGPIELHSCKDCQQEYADSLLRAWRAMKSKDETKNMGKLTTALNTFDLPCQADLKKYAPEPTDFVSEDTEEGDWEELSLEGESDAFEGFVPSEYE